VTNPRYAWRHISCDEAVPAQPLDRMPRLLGGFLFGVSLLLAGCASAPPPLPVEVRVPVATPCVQSIPDRPALLWDGLGHAEVYEQVRALLIDRGRLLAWSHEAEALLVACAAPAPAR